MFSIEIRSGKLSDLSADALIFPADEQFSLFAPEVLRLLTDGKSGILNPDTTTPLTAGMAAAFESDLPSFPYFILANQGTPVKSTLFRKAVYYSLLVAEANQFKTAVISCPDFLSAGLPESDFTENLIEMLRKFRQESGLLTTVFLWVPDPGLAQKVKSEVDAKIPEAV